MLPDGWSNLLPLIFATYYDCYMASTPEISFDNTEFAFEYKTDKQLKKARFLFNLMGKSWIVKLGTWLAPWWATYKRHYPQYNLFSIFRRGNT